MSPSYLLLVFIALCAFSNVLGDVYMQNPRGCNDRFDEEGDRQNAQRLFDSENNARGGYCWGPELTYYEGSILSVEWTAQHACGNGNTKCNIVLQYMCSSDDEKAEKSLIIRDGLTTNTIPTSDNSDDGANYYNYIAPGQTKYQFGMNEPLSVYTTCRARSRNKGLFVGEENVNNNQGAMATRQNNNGQRHGFECSEERDYYPYWHPSVWKDIAVLVDDKDECGFYQKESQNVKAKNFCQGTTAGQKAANNYEDCTREAGTWTSQPSWGLKKPDCKEAAVSRDNHLGNGVDAHTNSYNWTLPRPKQESCIENGNCTCILRIRYNITVGEVLSSHNSLNNGVNSPVQDDPDVTVEGMNFTLALDTAQTGRGFQDRSYMFRIAPRPKGVSKDANIYNLNVRGKRGNIVQAYPATEYDFVPTFLEVDQNDFVHFQWTGCDKNPANNQGEGKQKTDRSNIVQIADMSKNYPLTDSELKKTKLLFKDASLRKRMAMADQNPKDCLSKEALEAAGNEDQNDNNCMVLNAAPQRFAGGLVKMTSPGSYYYMSTRNNNFSNRSQKGSIKVKETWKAWKTAVIVIGGVAALGVGAAAGAVFYSKRHPLSKVAEVVHKVPGLNKI
jgi:hypothetical protein